MGGNPRFHFGLVVHQPWALVSHPRNSGHTPSIFRTSVWGHVHLSSSLLQSTNSLRVSCHTCSGLRLFFTPLLTLLGLVQHLAPHCHAPECASHLHSPRVPSPWRLSSFQGISGPHSAEGQSHTQAHISRSYIICLLDRLASSYLYRFSRPAPLLAALKHTMGTAGPLLSKTSFTQCLSSQLQLFLVSFRSLFKYHLLGT